MPYKAFKQGDKWCVHKHDTDGNPMGDAMGCHATEDEANAQVKALYANEGVSELTDGGEPQVIVVSEAVQDTIVSEFGGKTPKVPYAPGVDPTELLKDDPSPMFLVLPISQSGKVSRNGLQHDDELGETLVQQIMSDKPGGIMGHIPDDRRSTEYPVSQIHWVGAVRENGVTWAKGYIPRTMPDVREEFRILKAKRGKAATSIYGKAVKEMASDGSPKWRARRFQLEQIDLAPHKRAALPGSGEFEITAEMALGEPDEPEVIQEIQPTEGKIMTDKTEVLKELTVADLSSELKQAVVAEFQQEQGRVDRIAELEAETAQKDARIVELEQQVSRIAELEQQVSRLAELESAQFEHNLEAQIAELTDWQVNTDEGKAVLANLRAELKAKAQNRLGTVQEMESVVSTVKELMEGDAKWLVEMARDKLAGPSVTVPPKNANGDTKVPTADEIAAARARTGI
jgi:hypothetical protein